MTNNACATATMARFFPFRTILRLYKALKYEPFLYLFTGLNPYKSGPSGKGLDKSSHFV